ncbi:prothymosin alpha-A [Heterodontus francisci]|uniref:prothymosin alpha-A n=1 Tax=Heterodontus francisci TaxID=7792 RepID=UPI00355B50D5
MREPPRRALHSRLEPYLHCLQPRQQEQQFQLGAAHTRSSPTTMSESKVEISVERVPKDLKKTQEVEPENGKGDAPANGNAGNEENGEEVEENADEVEDEESEDVGEDDEEEEDEEDEEGDDDECEGAAEKRVAEDEEDDVAKKKQKTDAE